MQCKRKRTYTRRRTYSRKRVARYANGGYNPTALAVRGGDRRIIKIGVGVNYGSFTTTASTNYFGALSFKLSDVSNATDFSTTWDQYRLDAIRVDFIPQCSSSIYYNGSSVVNPPSPILVTAVDYDDNSTPSAIGTIQQFENSINHGVFSASCVKKYTRTFVPQFKLQTAGSSSGAPARLKWIDQGDPNETHYGLKYVLYSPSGTPAITFTIMAYFWISTKYKF